MPSIQSTLKRNMLITFILFLIGLSSGYYFLVFLPHQAGETRIAVAANFRAPMERLITLFQTQMPHKVFAEYGATGQLYKQIENGDRFDIFLAANTSQPKLLEQQGPAVPNTYFIYAIGKLVLWSNQPGLVDAQGEILRTGQFQRLAIAPIEEAPYGKAAKQTLEKLGLWESLWPRVVQGIDLTHTHQLIVKGEAQLGFLALSQLEPTQPGSQWIVPQQFYEPLESSAILLKQGEHNGAALAFLAFLKSPPAKEIIEAFGYAVP